MITGLSLSSLLATWRAAVAGTNHPQPPAYDGPDVALTGFTEKSGEVEPGMAFIARVRAGSDGHPDYQRLLDRADKALYAAKHAGRNRCVMADE